MGMEQLGRILVILGLFLLIIGALVLLGGRLLPLGRLPGDIAIERDNIRVYIPLATMLLLSIGLSIILTIVANLLGRR